MSGRTFSQPGWTSHLCCNTDSAHFGFASWAVGSVRKERPVYQIKKTCSIAHCHWVGKEQLHCPLPLPIPAGPFLTRDDLCLHPSSLKCHISCCNYKDLLPTEYVCVHLRGCFCALQVNVLLSNVQHIAQIEKKHCWRLLLQLSQPFRNPWELERRNGLTKGSVVLFLSWGTGEM